MAKVLVVDDDVVSRMVLMHLVDASGDFEILEAADGEDAWRQFEAGQRPDICFCDLRMPLLSGMELLARVKADPALAPTRFVLVSAAAERDTRDEAAALGADGYIVKPFDAAQVRQRLAALSAGTAEHPGDTLRRLGIDGRRLALYLDGLHKQLGAAGPEVEALLADGELAAAGARIASLRAACETLGLAGAAAVLSALEGQAASAGAARRAFELACGAVLRQGERARRLGA